MSKFIRNLVIDAAGALVAATALYGCADSEASTAKQNEQIAMRPAVPAAIVETAETAAVKELTPARVVPTDVSYEDAFAAFRKGDYETARLMFESYTAANDGDGQGQYMLGLSAWKTGDHELANRALARAVELNGESVKARTNLARVLLEQNKPREAMVHIEKAVDLAPQSHEVWRVLGNTLAQIGEREDALHAYRQAIMIDEKDAWSMNNYGLLLIQTGRPVEALPPLARAVELVPTSTMFLNNLGIALEASSDVAGARDVFTRVLEIDSTHAKAKVSLERVIAKLGSTEVEPTDLTQFARLFEDEVRRWKEPNPLQ